MRPPHRRTLCVLAVAVVAGLTLPSRVRGDDLSEQVANHKVLLDTLWVLLTAFLVFWMQAGFAYVEGGLTRAKNTNNIMMKNLMDFCLGTVAYWAVGFGIMFADGNPFMGLSGFYLNGADNSPATGDAYQGVFTALNWTGIPLYAKFMFQLVFAGTAATIVSGAMAERTKFSAYLIYSFAISALIYPVVGHWIWGGGWLSGAWKPSIHAWDFAGSTVVHSVGGWLALTGAWVLGPRIGKYGPGKKINAIPGHSLPMAALGVFILWLGWFGFNPGSTMAADLSIGQIAMTTNMAAAAGAIASMCLSWVLFRKADISMTLNGVLAGLVAVTAPCAFISPVSAAAIGVLGGFAVVLAIPLFDKLGIDDPVGAVSVHGVCGALGTLCVGLFAQESYAPANTTGNGLFFGGGAALLISQFVAVGSVFAWSTGTGLVLFTVLKYTMGLRVTAEEEVAGLDVGEHGSEAYPGFSIAVHGPLGHDGASLTEGLATTARAGKTESPVEGRP